MQVRRATARLGGNACMPRASVRLENRAVRVRKPRLALEKIAAAITATLRASDRSHALECPRAGVRPGLEQKAFKLSRDPKFLES